MNNLDSLFKLIGTLTEQVTELTRIIERQNERINSLEQESIIHDQQISELEVAKEQLEKYVFEDHYRIESLEKILNDPRNIVKHRLRDE